jgi:SAM-dependent methyltransferase
MSFQDHFSKQARLYAEHRPSYPEAVFAYLAGLAPARDLAWDTGAGNGQVAVQLSRHFNRVIATDASAEQIQNAFPHPKVQYRVEPSEKTSLPTDSVDLITVGVAVHWFDLDAFYAEVRRVGKPGAILAVWTYHLPAIEPAIDRLMKEYYSETLAGFWPEDIHYLDENYRTLPFPFHEIDPPAFDMQTEWTLPAAIGFMASWSGTQRYLASQGRNPLDEILPELRDAWGDEDHSRLVKWPLYFRIGRISA